MKMLESRRRRKDEKGSKIIGLALAEI